MATRVPADRSSGVPAWRTQPVIAGPLAGIVGGIVFGMVMTMMMPPMMGMIGSLIGAPQLGWPLHLVFSAIIGAGFGVLLGRLATDWGPAAGLGLGYGFLWWILGPLLIMPTWMGMGPMLVKAFETPNLMSLVGHLIYGVVTGLTYRAITR
ncbi:MAG: hypothetical protein ACRDT4_27225 [Micromonosporaceae bacterium]